MSDFLLPKELVDKALQVVEANRSAGKRIAVAESCTGGLVSAAITEIAGSSDPAFRGDPARWNPEELLLASVSACHKLWYLHFCAVSGVVVTDYVDHAEGTMVTEPEGDGRFTEIVLKPQVTIGAGDAALAEKLHHDAHEKCFIANSVNFPIRCEAAVTAA